MLKAVNRDTQFVHQYFAIAFVFAFKFSPYQSLMMIACGVCGQASPRGTLPARLSKSCGQTGSFSVCPQDGRIHKPGSRPALFQPVFPRDVRASFVQPSIRFLSVKPEPRYLSDSPFPSQSTGTAFFDSRVGTRFGMGVRNHAPLSRSFFSSIHPRFFSIAFQQRGIPHRFVS
jgi:hypothetical protein